MCKARPYPASRDKGDPKHSYPPPSPELKCIVWGPRAKLPPNRHKSPFPVHPSKFYGANCSYCFTEYEEFLHTNGCCKRDALLGTEGWCIRHFICRIALREAVPGLVSNISETMRGYITSVLCVRPSCPLYHLRSVITSIAEKPLVNQYGEVFVCMYIYKTTITAGKDACAGLILHHAKVCSALLKAA